jgi:uncharacterized membrane protein
MINAGTRSIKDDFKNLEDKLDKLVAEVSDMKHDASDIRDHVMAIHDTLDAHNMPVLRQRHRVLVPDA